MGNSASQNWTIYEANVQQYRVLSATVQSFLLTIGSILFTSTQPVPGLLLMMIFGIGVLHVLWVWVPVVYARHKVIDYYKFQHDCNLTEEQRAQLANVCTEKQYVKLRDLRKPVNKEYFNNSNLSVWRLTRVKLDLAVPIAYVVFWMGLALWKKPWIFQLWP
jgi:hypothetical protein